MSTQVVIKQSCECILQCGQSSLLCCTKIAFVNGHLYLSLKFISFGICHLYPICHLYLSIEFVLNLLSVFEHKMEKDIKNEVKLAFGNIEHNGEIRATRMMRQVYSQHVCAQQRIPLTQQEWWTSGISLSQLLQFVCIQNGPRQRIGT